MSLRQPLRLIAFTVVLATAALPFRASATVPGIDQVRLSWQHDPTTTMTIMWRTPSTFSGLPRVQYGATSAYGAEGVGTSQPAVLDGFTYHTVELTGLTANTAYHYHVLGPSGAWNDDATFRTAPAGPADFTFTVFADNGIRANGGDASIASKDLVLAQQPAFHLVVGDLTYADGDQCGGRSCVREHWEEWFNEIERFSRTVPVMPAIGNHDVDSDVQLSGGELFYTRSFALPPDRGERFYSFDYGGVHFIALDSNDEQGLRRGGAQYAWLEHDLAASTAARFTVVYFHHLAYTSGGEHDVTSAIQEETTPLFDRYGVDLVINGHNHHYERSYPLRYGAPRAPQILSTDRSRYVNPGGPVYVVTGGGGAGIYAFPSTIQPWSVVHCACHEILRVDVDHAGSLTVRAIQLDGTLVDEFTIALTEAAASAVHLSSPPAPTLPPPPQSSTPSTSASGSAPLAPVLTDQAIRGFNVGGWWHDALESSSAQRSFDRLAATGATEVAIAPFWYQDRKDSTRIFRQDEKTPTDDSVRAAIRYAKSKGLHVALKPMVDARDGTWRGQFTPSDVGAWFASYDEFLTTFAHLAADEGVDRLIVGTELASLTGPAQTARWRALIAKVRGIYRGPLTYAANWGERNDGEYTQIQFWDALDAIGIDAYFPLSSVDRPTVADVEAGWRSTTRDGRTVHWYDDIRQLHEQVRKPVIFTEIGYLSCERAGEKPWEYPCRHAVAPEVQANLYEGTLRFWANVDWMLGFHFWRWDTNPDAGGATNGDYVPQGKLAEEVLRRYWTATVPATSSASSVGNTVFGHAPGSGASSASGSGASSAPGNVFTAPPTPASASSTRSLVKLACPGTTPVSHPCRTVYWYASDGQRYAFPNEAVYRTWFSGFFGVHIVTRDQLAAMPLGGLVTHRPGVRLVKLPYSTKVYAVDRGATLRWVPSEADARTVAGASWVRMVDDLPEWLFGYYHVGTPIGTVPAFNADAVRNAVSDLDSEIREAFAARRQ